MVGERLSSVLLPITLALAFVFAMTLVWTASAESKAGKPVPEDRIADVQLLGVNDFHGKWNDIQAGFVDEPRRAVEQADGLVADAIKRLAESFAKERAQLEGQWVRGGDVSTEDLRQALQRYRSFFSRLLSV